MVKWGGFSEGFFRSLLANRDCYGFDPSLFDLLGLIGATVQVSTVLLSWAN
jgi:hypothetical protein